MNGKREKRSIFRSLFVPVIIIMVVQALIFYIAAVYGGIKETLSQNAVDIMSGSMLNRKNEIETDFNNRWTALDDCISELDRQYANFSYERGNDLFASDTQNQIDFLKAAGDTLISTLRYSQANGIFLILNDLPYDEPFMSKDGEQKYGLCIRDMDQENSYTGREDLLLERAPSSIVDTLGCLLDSWWEAKYSFTDCADGDYFYAPLSAAYEHFGSDSRNLAYLSSVHQISDSDPKMVSYSVPLFSKDGYPYAVLGIELSVKYLSSQLPNAELFENDKGCYVLSLYESDTDKYTPVAGSGVLFNRCFGDTVSIERGETTKTGGFLVTGRDKTQLYTTETELDIYNNNNPFESRRLVLLAMVEERSLFSYISRIELVLFVVSLLSLALGVIALIVVSRRFAAPITALARKAGHINKTNPDYRSARIGISELEHIGITEIDQLVDSIEELNRNVSRNSARTEFFSRMSHDMRTPMNAIISFSSHEILEIADEKAKDEYLERIHDSGVYLLGLINEVLDMTKIESNKTELHMSKVRAAELFDTPMSMIEKLAQNKNIKFTTNIGLSHELFIMADEQHLSQIVMNLLSNAVKFTPEGGEVKFTAEITAEKMLYITVTDNGIGMSKEFIDKLYTPFSQESGNHEGTGLGLTISKKLIELMGGSIKCQSEKNKGTAFSVSLPIVFADSVESDTEYKADDKESRGQAEDSETRDESNIQFEGQRVLVCEDNAINIKIIQLLLERVGLNVEVAENGKQGVEMFKSSEPWKYSAILMDIRMPIMNGIDASIAIRHLDREDAAAVPIIAMTADAFAEDEQTSLSAGMNEHLSKPIDTKKLYITLAKYIK